MKKHHGKDKKLISLTSEETINNNNLACQSKIRDAQIRSISTDFQICSA